MLDSNLLKMAEFSAQAGVPAPTIRHYVREGLLPDPVRTSKTMAYYDQALVPRVRAIKQIQEQLFLPLPIIREVLDEVEEGEDVEATAMSLAIRRVLSMSQSDETRTRDQLLASGMPADVLDRFIELQVVTPTQLGTDEVYGADDVAMLRTLKQARSAGLDPDMLPPEILAQYMSAIASLVRVELSLFRSGVVPRARDHQDLQTLTETATRLSEQLVVQLRRKLLLPLLDELFASSTGQQDNE